MKHRSLQDISPVYMFPAIHACVCLPVMCLFPVMSRLCVMFSEQSHLCVSRNIPAVCLFRTPRPCVSRNVSPVCLLSVISQLCVCFLNA
jgi:hypothetical protein